MEFVLIHPDEGTKNWLEHTRDALRLRDWAIEELVAERDKLHDRASLLESAVKTYASHVWNDIEARLSGVDV